MIPENETDCYALQKDPTAPDYFFTGFFCYIQLPYICEYECNYIFSYLLHFLLKAFPRLCDTNIKRKIFMIFNIFFIFDILFQYLWYQKTSRLVCVMSRQLKLYLCGVI